MFFFYKIKLKTESKKVPDISDLCQSVIKDEARDEAVSRRYLMGANQGESNCSHSRFPKANYCHPSLQSCVYLETYLAGTVSTLHSRHSCNTTHSAHRKWGLRSKIVFANFNHFK